MSKKQYIKKDLRSDKTNIPNFQKLRQEKNNDLINLLRDGRNYNFQKSYIIFS